MANSSSDALSSFLSPVSFQLLLTSRAISLGPPTSVLPDQCGLPPSQAETGSNPRDPKSFSKKHKFEPVLSCFLCNQITMLWASPFSDTPCLKDPKHARLAMAESLWVQSAHGHLHCQCPEPVCGTSKSSNIEHGWEIPHKFGIQMGKSSKIIQIK